MSPSVSEISSNVASRVSHLALLNNLPSNQKVFSLTSDTISRLKLNFDPDAVDYSAIYASEDPGIQGILDDLREYFKNIKEEIEKNSDIIIEHVKEIDWNDKDSILNGLGFLLDYLKPLANYVKEHPWILLPLFIPAFELFLFAIGFQMGGVTHGSLASKLQSRIGKVPKGHLFAFCQSVGAGGWAFEALERANMFITVAVLIIAIGEILIDKGIIDPEKIKQTLEGMWIRSMETLDPPPVHSTGTQLAVLNLNHGWVKYGVLASVVMPLFVCAGEGL